MRDYKAMMVMKMNHYFHLHHHPSLFLLSHLKQRLLRLPPSSTAAVEASRVQGEIVGNLNERVTCSSRLAHLSCFLNCNTHFLQIIKFYQISSALGCISKYIV
jgi:hypothetical protein